MINFTTSIIIRMYQSCFVKKVIFQDTAKTILEFAINVNIQLNATGIFFFFLN